MESAESPACVVCGTIENDELRKSIESARKALGFGTERDDSIKKEACASTFLVYPDWLHFLDVTYRQRVEMAQIFTFERQGREFKMSTAAMGARLGFIDHHNLWNDLADLCDKKYLMKQSNGLRKPVTYRIRYDQCITSAIFGGWEPPNM